MIHTGRIIKNSFLLVSQQLMLNIVSIFSIGYVARYLGQLDYGKFVFAFSFINLFLPFTNFGIGAVITREMTENINDVDSIFGKIIVFRENNVFCRIGNL